MSPPDVPSQPVPPATPPDPPPSRRGDYPTVASVLDDARTYLPDVLRALKSFRAEKPWQGTPQERINKLNCLHTDLCICYRLSPPPSLVIPSHADGYHIERREIHVSNRLSVLSYLHEFAHAIGLSERAACGWSINLFRRIFPRSYANLVPVGHMLVRREDVHALREALGLEEGDVP